MRFSTAAAFLGAALGSANAFLIPEGQPSGVYSVEVDENGTEHHVRVGDVATQADLLSANGTASPATRRRSSHERRWVDGVPRHWTAECYPEEIAPAGQDMDHGSFLRATAALDAQMPPGKQTVVRRGNHLYSIDECVVAYFCGFANPAFWWGDITVTVHDRKWNWDLIDEKCGLWHPGSSHVLIVTKGSHYTHIAYGREVYCTAKGHNFCSSGTG